MHFVLAGFCAVNCWVIPKLWEHRHRLRNPGYAGPPRGGTVVPIRPGRHPHVTITEQPLLLAA